MTGLAITALLFNGLGFIYAAVMVFTAENAVLRCWFFICANVLSNNVKSVLSTIAKERYDDA